MNLSERLHVHGREDCVVLIAYQCMVAFKLIRELDLELYKLCQCGYDSLSLVVYMVMGGPQYCDHLEPMP